MSAAQAPHHAATCACTDCDFERKFAEESAKARESTTRQIAAAQKLRDAIEAVERGDSKLIRLPKRSG